MIPQDWSLEKQDIMNTEETFLAEEISNMQIQHECLQDTLPPEYTHSPFRDSMNQPSSEEIETFYNKVNY